MKNNMPVPCVPRLYVRSGKRRTLYFCKPQNKYTPLGYDLEAAKEALAKLMESPAGVEGNIMTDELDENTKRYAAEVKRYAAEVKQYAAEVKQYAAEVKQYAAEVLPDPYFYPITRDQQIKRANTFVEAEALKRVRRNTGESTADGI